MPRARPGAVIAAAVTAVALTCTAVVAFFVVSLLRGGRPNTVSYTLAAVAMVAAGTAASSFTASWALRAFRSAVGFEDGVVRLDRSATRVSELRDVLTCAEAVADAFSAQSAASSKLAELHLRSAASSDEMAHETATRLHDGVLQAVIATRLQLEAGRATDAVKWLQDAEVELRSVASTLSPSITAGGLNGALVQLCERRSGDGTQIIFTNASVGDPPRAATFTLLRAATECVSNAKRWGRAEHVAVTLSGWGTLFALTVTDDGSGFDPTRPSDGFGLFALRSEVEALGGQMALISTPGEGTTVAVHLPVRTAAGCDQGPPG